MAVPDDLMAEVREVERLAAGADRDPAAISAALDRLTALYQALEAARRTVAEIGPELVVRGLAVGMDPGSLARRPYSSSRVRELAREAGIPPARPGPRRAARRSGAEVLADMDREARQNEE